MPNNNRVEEMKKQNGTRNFAIESFRTISAEERTVEVCFSSDAPIERWGDLEILDHDSKSVRLERINNSAPVLVNHDRDDHVGVVVPGSVTVDAKEGKGRAVLRFGKSERAEEIFNDVVDGIRVGVSVGYRIYEVLFERGAEGELHTYRIVDWEPTEISIASVEADTNAGVGRTQDEPKPNLGDQPKPETQKPTPIIITKERAMPDPVVKSPEDIRAEIDAGRKEVLRTINEITALAKQFDCRDLADEHIEKGSSIEEFKTALLARQSDHQGKEKKRIQEAGIDDKDAQQYSFTRAMLAAAMPNDKRAQEAAAFELEVSAAAAERSGIKPSGILIPPDVMRMCRMSSGQRDLNVGTGSAGGNLVDTQLLTSSFIDLLRNKLIIAQLGGSSLFDLVGNLSVPGQSGAATAYWVTEGGDVTESQQTVRQVPLTPKTLGAFTEVTRQLLLQSSIDVENFVKMDFARIIALAIDLAAMYGTGLSGQPTGINATAGIGSETFAGVSPTFAELVALETDVATANADVGTLGYAINPAQRGNFKTTEKFATTGQTIWEPGNTVNGYKTGVSNQVVAGDVFFGNWADLIMGYWGGLDLLVDPYTKATSGGIRLVALQSVDIAVRNTGSFSVGRDA